MGLINKRCFKCKYYKKYFNSDEYYCSRHRITNNWLKVHGGIMERKAWRRKRHVRS